MIADISFIGVNFSFLHFFLQQQINIVDCTASASALMGAFLD